jgi:uncharacterized protein (DUF302 family)
VALAEQGFGIITEIDRQATMSSKLDKDYAPYLILGACNPELADKAISIYESIGTLLPCNVVVRASNGTNIVEVLDPQVMVQLTGVPELAVVAVVADDAAERLSAALESVAAAESE